MKARGGRKTLVVLVADVDDAVLILQPFRGWNVGTAVKWAVLCYYKSKFQNSINGEPRPPSIKVVDL